MEAEIDFLNESESTKKDSGASKLLRIGTTSTAEKVDEKNETYPYQKKRSNKSVGFDRTVDVIYVESYKSYNKLNSVKKKPKEAHCECTIM